MIEGDAVVYCAGAFLTTFGKTAHGLVRFTERYRVRAVIDPDSAGRDAGEVLDGRRAGIPIVADLVQALRIMDTDSGAEPRPGDERSGGASSSPPRYFVIGIAPDGGVVTPAMRIAVRQALEAGFCIDSGLHEFFSDDGELAQLAVARGLSIRDVRKTPPRSQLHSFTGRIETVDSVRIAVLGTDSAIGKRTTAWILTHALQRAGISTQMIGTGQTAWMQGARYGVILDSLINDFVAGEIEHAVVSAWESEHPRALVLEGQGSLMNPAYPGGFELLAAGRPHAVVLQHAPARHEYDGFPGYPIQPLPLQIQAIELLSGRPVVAVTVNHEGLNEAETSEACRAITSQTGLPSCDPIRHGVDPVVEALQKRYLR